MIATILGLIAAVLTTTSFIPQVVQVWKTHQTKDLSLPMYLILFGGFCLWFVYGLLIGSIPVIAANAACIVLSLTIIIMKLRYG